ncbi:MAG: hypothetical protein SO072_09130 [Dysosmobacter sp.]|nr:hypothetical protein [Dysosmobacter sp.]
MYIYDRTNYKQQVEIMRRCTEDALNTEFFWDDELIEHLKILFFTHSGITAIAHFFNCTEVEIMRKIQELDLYHCYNFPLFHQWCGDDENDPDSPKGDQFNSNEYTRSIELLRRLTPDFNERQFIWDEEKLDLLDRMFCASEDITRMALTLGCTEPMVMRKVLEERLYQCMDFPLFSYCY